MECRDSADTCSNFRSTVQALALSKATVTLFESISQLLDQLLFLMSLSCSHGPMQSTVESFKCHVTPSQIGL